MLALKFLLIQLPDAFEQFENSCLEPSWQEYGAAYVGLFGVIASFAVQLIEYTISNMGGLAHSHEVNISPKEIGSVAGATTTASQSDDNGAHVENSHLPVASSNGQFGVSTNLEMVDVQISKPSVAVEVEQSAQDTEHNHVPRDPAVAVILLECGIIIHSFIIGLTLGTTGDSVYLPLLIAIVFHQVFEGMALGALIAMLKFESPYSKYLLCLMYPIVTPIGNAIGIAIRSNYNANNHATILTQGIFGSISAGILFYNTYSELIASEINNSKSFRKLSSFERGLSFFFMYFGAAAMAVLAIWA